MPHERIDYFFQQHHKRLRERFRLTTIERHEARVENALYARREAQRKEAKKP